MPWKHSSAQALKKLVGVYALPGGCWAVLTLHPAPAKTEKILQACPEGYDYAFAVLAPGTPPKLRGHRMAGIDNSDDKHVRAQTNANPASSRHRAHRHLPDWKRLKMVGLQEWPEASHGVQLASAPQTPQAFWLACMDCLEHTLSGLGLDMPPEEELMQSHLSEDDFRRLQDSLGSEPGPRPAS